MITAVVLGGTSLFGGRGSVLGTSSARSRIGVIANGLILLRVSPFFTQIVTGLVILPLAIFANSEAGEVGAIRK